MRKTSEASPYGDMMFFASLKMMLHASTQTMLCLTAKKSKSFDLDFLAQPFKIDPQSKFFRNRSVVFGRWIDLPLDDDGSCTLPLSSGALLHACKRIYVVILVFSKLPIGINQISFFVHNPRVCKQIKQILCRRFRNVFFIVFCRFPKFVHRILCRELLKRGYEL